MAEYLIQSETLDDIADAINAKTGGSSAMTPAQMVAAIESISGGGEKVYTKLGEVTIAEPVHSVSITLTEQMKNCECLYLVCDSIVLSAADWVYPTINNSGSVGYVNNKSTSLRGTFVFAPIKKPTQFSYVGVIPGALPFLTANGVTEIPAKLGVTSYDRNTNFTSGKIEIWGYV